MNDCYNRIYDLFYWDFLLFSTFMEGDKVESKISETCRLI